mgnify:CR=1 FL=1
MHGTRVAGGSIGAVATSRSVGKAPTRGSFMLVNNEVGVINPIKQLSSKIHSLSSDALFHTDAVQALGKIDIDVRELGVDLLTLSAHKIHGPKGIGALFIRRGIKIEPLLHGGAQERNRRGGTESTALAVGFGYTIRQMQVQTTESRNKLKKLSKISFIKIFSDKTKTTIKN